MKAILLALCLLASASAAAARQKASENRQGDSFRGPVKSVRVEQADYRRVNGVSVEGPRRLVSVITYTPDGKRQESVDYAPDGSEQYRLTYVYDDDGNELEVSHFDAKGDLKMRRVQVPQAGETLVYEGDGSLRERLVIVRGWDGQRLGTMVYDGAGALKERHVGTREGGLFVWSVYRPDGTLKRRDTHALDSGGRRRTVLQTYNERGVLVRRRVLESDAAATERRSAVETGSGDGEPPRTRDTREYDSHKNPSKLTRYSWSEAAGGYEPSSVTYYTITYYR